MLVESKFNEISVKQKHHQSRVVAVCLVSLAQSLI